MVGPWPRCSITMPDECEMGFHMRRWFSNGTGAAPTGFILISRTNCLDVRHEAMTADEDTRAKPPQRKETYWDGSASVRSCDRHPTFDAEGTISGSITAPLPTPGNVPSMPSLVQCRNNWGLLGKPSRNLPAAPRQMPDSPS